MIRLENVHKSFDGSEVLRGVSFEVKKGEVLALIGGSGEGKSVILKHVVGLIKPDRGNVYIDGVDIQAISKHEIERLRSRFAFLFQGGALFSSLTVYENVAFPLREKTGLGEEEIRQRVLQVLDQVGLKGSEDKYPAQLSGGMIKRTALARALVGNPEIMLFDEPTTGLDPVIARTILDLIKDIYENLRFTGIIVSHELARVFQIVHKVALLHKGTIIEIGSPEEIRSSSNPVVRQFITGAVMDPIGLDHIQRSN